MATKKQTAKQINSRDRLELTGLLAAGCKRRACGICDYCKSGSTEHLRALVLGRHGH